MESKNILFLLWLIIFYCLISGINAQDYVSGKLYIKVIDDQGIPEIEDKGSQILISMQNATLKNIFETYGVYEFKPAFPLLDQIVATNKYGLDSVYLIECTGNQELLMNSIISNQSGEYEFLEQIPVTYSLYTPNDYHILDNIMGADTALDLMKAKQAWDVTKGDSTILLGIHEKGSISINHPDLIGKVQIIGDMGYYNPWHGDFVVGCVAANTDNNAIKSGMGFNCKMIYKQHEISPCGSEWMELYLNGAKAISISWATHNISQIPQDVINLLTDLGVLFIAGAGNGYDPDNDIFSDTTFQYPASNANVLSVTSVDNTKHHYVTYQSDNPVHTHNDSVDVSAPGRNVIGLAPNNSYATGSGTSFAAPYVAGIAGLIYSINPCLTPQEVTHIIKSTTENIDAQNPNYIGKIGTGLVDAYAAVSLAQQDYSFKSYTIANGQEIIWDSVMNCSKVLIEDGGKLHINSNAEIYMVDTGRIIVEPGGELMIRGAIITKSRCFNFWKGIEVRGNESLSQITQNQGAVRVMDNAIIEYAECGIRAYGMENGSPITNSGGGIVLATGGSFINNKTAIKINDYIFTNALGYPQNNESVVLSNNIEINDDYFLLTNDEPIGVHLSSVKQVAINGNEFLNEASGTTGIGTYIFNSDAFISKYIIPNTYDGWDYGVKALGMRSSNTIYMDDNVFQSCNTGAYLSSITNATIIFNQFEMVTDQTGLYLDNCNDFIVEVNSFASNYNPVYGTNSFGMVINNSGPYINEVYKNNFDQIKYAALAQDQNRAANGDGLSFKCNTFTSNGFDISVVDSINVTGISQYQGSNDSLDITAPAGNIFSNIGSVDPTDINNQEQQIIYYHPQDNLYFNVIPIYTLNTLLQLNDQPFIADSSCPSNYSGGGSGGIEEIRGLMTSSGQTADSINNIIVAMEDGGNTEELSSEVYTSIPPEAMFVYNELMGTSPYLSDSVVETAIIKEEVLPNAMIRDVMVANPQSAKNNELIDAVDERSNPMSDYMKAQILQGKSIISAFEQLKSNYAYNKNLSNKAYQQAKNWYLRDTLNPEQSYDSLLCLLNQRQEVKAKYQLVSYYLQKNDVQEATNQFNEIPNQLELSNYEQAEYIDMQNFYGLLFYMQQNNQGIDDLSNEQLSLLEDLETNGHGQSKSLARNIRLNLGLSDYAEPYIIPDLYKSAEMFNFEAELLKSIDEVKYLDVFPNPAKDYVILKYLVENNVATSYLQITNTSGIVLETIEVLGSEDQIVIDIKNYKSGVYIATQFINGEVAESVKFNIIK